MNALLNIPKHNCRNCGECCGLIPATPYELTQIKEYLHKHEDIRAKAVKQSGEATCPFRDRENKRCLIYPVRPVICGLFGVAKQLRCPYGNSGEIDADRFIDKNVDLNGMILLNSYDWTLRANKDSPKLGRLDSALNPNLDCPKGGKNYD